MISVKFPDVVGGWGALDVLEMTFIGRSDLIVQWGSSLHSLPEMESSEGVGGGQIP